MSRGKSNSGKSLATVTRYYELLLEQARVARAEADDAASRQRKLAEHIQSRIDSAQNLALDQMKSEAGVTADALRRNGSYAQWQLRALAEQREKVREAERLAEQALTEVKQRFQALAAIEQLRERRARDAALESSQHEQKALDEHASLRAANPRAPERTTEGDTQWP